MANTDYTDWGGSKNTAPPTATVNAAKLNLLGAEVETNKTQIATHTSQIGTHTSQIGTHTSQIAANTSQIGTHTSQIAANTSQIAANTTAIAAAGSNLTVAAFAPSAIVTASEGIAANNNDTTIPTSAAVNAATAAATPGIIDVTRHGIIGDGTTDNFTALTALIAATAEGQTLYFPPTANNLWYCTSQQIVINKSITLKGQWNRGTISGPIVGSVLAATTTAAQLAMGSLIKVAAARVRISGLAILGRPTLETNATVTINGTNVHLSSLTATSALVGARVSGPTINSGTTVAAVNTGTNNITLSQATTGEPISSATSTSSALTLVFRGAHDLAVGDSITLTGFTPSAYNATWVVATVVDWRTVQITSAANPGAASVVGTYTAAKAGCPLRFGADGIEFNSSGEMSHLCYMDRTRVDNCREGVAFGFSDHVTLTDCEIVGNHDNISFRSNNGNDYSFINCDLTSATRASLYVAKHTTVVNISCIRSHLGWSKYGIFQDIATGSDGNGLKGVSFIATPIEAVSVRHISIANGGGMFFDHAGYWHWSAGTPNTPALVISGLQNTGSITFQAALEGNNPNCPYLFYAGGQIASSVFRMETTLITAAGTFANAALPSIAYNSDDIPGQIFFSGNLAQFSSATNVNVYGPLNMRNSGSTGGTLYGGAGAPPGGLGVNGDVYFRNDTPATTNQRIYIKSAGAWTGIA